MLLGLRSGGTHEKTIRQIARNLKTCGGYFSYLPSPERRTVSKEREPVVGGATALTVPMVSRGKSFDSSGDVAEIGPSPEPSHIQRADLAGLNGTAYDQKCHDRDERPPQL